MCESCRCVLLLDMVRHTAGSYVETHSGKFANIHEAPNNLMFFVEPRE